MTFRRYRSLTSRAAHARRVAQRLVHRLNRHADRADRQEHTPRRLRGYISAYDIQCAVEDKPVPTYYESRLAKLELDETERPTKGEDA